VRKLGAGSFGEVFLAYSITITNSSSITTTVVPAVPAEAAVKVETSGPYPQLARESRLLKEFRSVGFPAVYYTGVAQGSVGMGDYTILVMELLSHSLEDLLHMCHGKFTLKTNLLVAKQLLQRIESLHNFGFLHRDIKPENFLIGRKGTTGENTIFIIDFGLSKRYWNDTTNEHIPFADHKSLTGTARYASINSHKGYELSRRDDLEAIGYMLLYFMRGDLPWQGLPALTKEEKYTKIMDKKIETSVEFLCDSGIPEEFGTYLKYVRSLRFQDRPDYTYLKGLFADVMTRTYHGSKDGVSGGVGGTNSGSTPQLLFDWSGKIGTIEDTESTSPSISNRNRMNKLGLGISKSANVGSTNGDKNKNLSPRGRDVGNTGSDEGGGGGGDIIPTQNSSQQLKRRFLSHFSKLKGICFRSQ